VSSELVHAENLERELPHRARVRAVLRLVLVVRLLPAATNLARRREDEVRGVLVARHVSFEVTPIPRSLLRGQHRANCAIIVGGEACARASAAPEHQHEGTEMSHDPSYITRAPKTGY